MEKLNIFSQVTKLVNWPLDSSPGRLIPDPFFYSVPGLFVLLNLEKDFQRDKHKLPMCLH